MKFSLAIHLALASVALAAGPLPRQLLGPSGVLGGGVGSALGGLPIPTQLCGILPLPGCTTVRFWIFQSSSNKSLTRSSLVGIRYHPRGDQYLHPHGDQYLHPHGDQYLHPSDLNKLCTITFLTCVVCRRNTGAGRSHVSIIVELSSSSNIWTY
jgi:hypothetical protein